LTDLEWRRVVKLLAENWSHQLQPESSLAKFRQELDEFSVAQVLVAVETLYRDGREFPPNAGHIRARLADLHFDAPPFYDALRMIRRAGHHPNDLIVEDDSEKGWHHEDRRMTFLEEKAPLLAGFVRAIGWDQISVGDGGDEARLRGKYEDFVRRAREAMIYRGLPPAGLRKLERVENGELVEYQPHKAIEPRAVISDGEVLRRVEREAPGPRRMGFSPIAGGSRE
jgi:hypothetical protein